MRPGPVDAASASRPLTHLGGAGGHGTAGQAAQELLEAPALGGRERRPGLHEHRRREGDRTTPPTALAARQEGRLERITAEAVALE